MSVTGSRAPADLLRDPPVPPSRRRRRRLACTAALVAAGALLLPSAASAVAAPSRAVARGAAAAKPTDELRAVSCPTNRMCVAVGESNFSATGMMLAERWNGHKWSVTRLAHPPGAMDSALTGVSCTSARACTAVGFDYVAATGGGPLAERWNGSRWALEVTPNPGQGGVPLAAVSCGSATSCTAVGYYDFGALGFTSSTLAEHWNGRLWAVQSLPTGRRPGRGSECRVLRVAIDLYGRGLLRGDQRRGSGHGAAGDAPRQRQLGLSSPHRVTQARTTPAG